MLSTASVARRHSRPAHGRASRPRAHLAHLAMHSSPHEKATPQRGKGLAVDEHAAEASRANVHRQAGVGSVKEARRGLKQAQSQRRAWQLAWDGCSVHAPAIESRRTRVCILRAGFTSPKGESQTPAAVHRTLSQTQKPRVAEPAGAAADRETQLAHEHSDRSLALQRRLVLVRLRRDL